MLEAIKVVEVKVAFGLHVMQHSFALTGNFCKIKPHYLTDAVKKLRAPVTIS